MNLEGAPVLAHGRLVRRPLYDYRSVHSGCGIDEYPDAEFNAIVHGGYDTIVLFVRILSVPPPDRAISTMSSIAPPRSVWTP